MEAETAIAPDTHATVANAAKAKTGEFRGPPRRDPSAAIPQPGEFPPFWNRKDGKGGKRTWEIRLFPLSPNFLFKKQGS
jgi:hypothetical protein